MSLPDRNAASNGMRSRCASCRAQVTVDLGVYVVVAADGRRLKVTYADTDIVVWDCPDCGFANADEVVRG